MVANLELLAALVYGQVLKVLSICWQLDSETNRPIRFPSCLWQGPEKYRTLGAWSLTLGLVFILPREVFDYLIAYHFYGVPLGYLSITFVGFIADDLFVLLPAAIAYKIRLFASRLDLPHNPNHKNRHQPLPSDFPQERKKL